MLANVRNTHSPDARLVWDQLSGRYETDQLFGVVLWLTADSDVFIVGIGETRGAEADEGRDVVIGNAQSKVKVGHIARTPTRVPRFCSALLTSARRGVANERETLWRRKLKKGTVLCDTWLLHYGPQPHARPRFPPR